MWSDQIKHFRAWVKPFAPLQLISSDKDGGWGKHTNDDDEKTNHNQLADNWWYLTAGSKGGELLHLNHFLNLNPIKVLKIFSSFCQPLVQVVKMLYYHVLRQDHTLARHTVIVSMSFHNTDWCHVAISYWSEQSLSWIMCIWCQGLLSYNCRVGSWIGAVQIY